MNMGRQGVEEGVSEMLKEVRKVVEQGKEMKVEEEARGIPKPSFLANLMAIQELHGRPECPAPRKKKAKKAHKGAEKNEFKSNLLKKCSEKY